MREPHLIKIDEHKIKMEEIDIISLTSDEDKNNDAICNKQDQNEDIQILEI